MATQIEDAAALDEPAGPEGAPNAPTRQRGRGLAMLALLVAIAALGAAGWVGYRTWLVPGPTAADFARLASDNAALEARLDRELAPLAATVDALAGEVANAQQKLQLLQEQQERQARQAATAGPGAQALPPAEAWQVAEAEYLLRVANHRLLLEADAAGAERMLAAADEALAAAAPFAYHEVRALLATERAALQAAAGTDVQGIFLRLDALKGQLGQLPLRLPEYIAERPKPQPAATTMLGALGERFSGLVRFRRSDENARPLLPPAQAENLLLNLRLALNHAQLAALRRDQAIFETSLANAAEWLADHVDTRHQASRAIAAELAALQAEDLAAELPDISGSLARLRAIRAPPEPAAE